jgi:hypothetical protein
MRPALVLQRAAATEIRRLFLGPLVPNRILRAAIPVVPGPRELAFQVVHSADCAEAFRLAVTTDARGAYNVASEPVIDRDVLARVLGARPVPMPGGVLRAAADLTWRLRLQPADPGWVDIILQTPLLDTGRISRELGWAATRTGDAVLDELVRGVVEGAGGDHAPALARRQRSAADARARHRCGWPQRRRARRPHLTRPAVGGEGAPGHPPLGCRP